METKATTKVGTDVVFKWSGYHNVYMFPSKAAFEKCDFSGAKELAGNDKNPFTYKASKPGTYYFGCEVGNGWHCEQQQKLAPKARFLRGRCAEGAALFDTIFLAFLYLP